MDTVYWIGLGLGGTLLAASLALGGKDGDGIDKGGVDKSLDSGGLGAAAPVGSLRFWTFFLAFGGLIGVLLGWLGRPAAPAAVAAIAGATGWTCGVAAVHLIRSLSRHSADSTTASYELVGSTGQLLLGVGKDAPGKLRLSAKGRSQDFVVETEDDEPIPAGASAMVVAPAADGRLVVTKPV